ncbi:MAG: hypothetical protein HXX18_01005 [Bacteroidetes bacterium]|nr:hypothetical protein [Bacteroidota bacterium]
MEENNNQVDLFDKVLNKAKLKQDVYKNTFEAAKLFKEVIVEIIDEFKGKLSPDETRISFEYKDRDAFEMELKFAGDVLIFMMHTNVFEFSRNSDIMRTNYIHEDKKRSYCGMINIYNFLADSFKYNRENDIGYLIGRVFINKENHFYIEGKKELGMIYNNFANNIMTKEAARDIVENAILYTSNFDLLTPPYDEVKEVTVFEIQANIDNIRLKTGKRLGFKFQIDSDNMIG